MGTCIYLIYVILIGTPVACGDKIPSPHSRKCIKWHVWWSLPPRSKSSQGMPYGDHSLVGTICTHRHCTEWLMSPQGRGRVMSPQGLHSYTLGPHEDKNVGMSAPGWVCKFWCAPEISAISWCQITLPCNKWACLIDNMQSHTHWMCRYNVHLTVSVIFAPHTPICVCHGCGFVCG